MYTTTSVAIAELVRQAVSEGWTVAQLRERLYQIYDRWSLGLLPDNAFEWLEQRTPAFRAKLMSETESILISSMAALALYEALGIVEVQWWTMEDERVCPWCGMLHGTIVGTYEPWFSPGETFTVDSHSLGIMRTIFSPPLHVYCRCFLVPIY